MIEKFTESIGSKLGERAAGLVTTGPFAYGVVVLAVWLITTGPGEGWSQLDGWIRSQSPAQLLAWAFAGLVILAAAGSVVKQFVPPTIRLLEGYWPRPFRSLNDRLSDRAWSQRVAAVEAVRLLNAAVTDGTASDEQERQFVSADAMRAQLPSKRSWTLPTRLGNRLRAAETRPYEKYALEPIKLWPVTWLVLPAPAREELVAARSRLDAATAGVLWCLLGVCLVFLAWWTALLAVGAGIAAYRLWVLPAGAGYAELFEAAYDVHRFDLYAALRLPPPANAATERITGRELTDFIWRGRDDDKLIYNHPSIAVASPSEVSTSASPRGG